TREDSSELREALRSENGIQAMASLFAMQNDSGVHAITEYLWDFPSEFTTPFYTGVFQPAIKAGKVLHLSPRHRTFDESRYSPKTSADGWLVTWLASRPSIATDPELQKLILQDIRRKNPSGR